MTGTTEETTPAWHFRLKLSRRPTEHEYGQLVRAGLTTHHREPVIDVHDHAPTLPAAIESALARITAVGDLDAKVISFGHANTITRAVELMRLDIGSTLRREHDKPWMRVLADWLDSCAAQLGYRGVDDAYSQNFDHCDSPGDVKMALRLATAYLNEDGPQ